MTGIIIGLLLFATALFAEADDQLWRASVVVASAAGVAALALYAVLQAVDGVTLKHAVDSWAAAPETERSSRFTAAETVRWLEWAIRSYHSYALGMTFILFGSLIARSRLVAVPIGYVMALAGIAYLAQGWVVGVSGFSDANTLPNLLAILFVLVWSVWLVIAAWRPGSSVAPHPS
jgi:hypothetical protein